MSRGRIEHVAGALGVFLLALWQVPTPALGGERKPAEVMSYLGADWLERPEREVEENTSLMLEQLGLRPGDVVADLGCGSGYHTRRIAPRVGPEGRVYAVDIQPEMLAILRRGLEAEGIENVTPILATETDPRLPEGSLDWILLVDVYHELQQPEPVLDAMRRALAPDGRVALVEFRLEGRSARHIKLDHRMSVEQVLAEWEPAGFELERLFEELPTQHLFIFRAKDDIEPPAASEEPLPCRGSDILVLAERVVGVVRGRVAMEPFANEITPMPGVSLSVFDEAGRRVALSETGAGGRFDLGTLPSGRYRLRVCERGFESLEVPLRVRATGSISDDLELRMSLAR